MRISRGVWVAFVVAAWGCAAGRSIAFPTGPGAPAPGAAAAWREAVSACRDIQMYHSDLRVKGTAAGRRVPPVTIGAKVTATHVGLTATAAGSTIFTLAGSADRSQLLVKDADGASRLVTARADEILETVIGLPIGPSALLALATGCVTPESRVVEAAAYGSRILVTLDGTRAVLMQDGRWRLAMAEAFGVRVSYSQMAGYWPVEWRVTTPPDRLPVTSLDIRADDPDVQTVASPAEDFAIPRIPDGTTPMRLDELRATMRRQ